MMRKNRKVKQKRGIQPTEFKVEDLEAEIISDAKAIHIPIGTAEVIAEKVATETAKWVTQRSVVTSDDINRRVAADIMKYSKDLSYVYQNRGKII